MKVSQFGLIPFSLLISVPLSVGLALLVTFITPAVEIEKLKAFHRRVQAGGIGWRKIDKLIKAEDPGFEAQTPLNWNNARNWFLASTTVYLWLVGIGKLIIGDTLQRRFSEDGSVQYLLMAENGFFLYLMIGLVLIGALRAMLGKAFPGPIAAATLFLFVLMMYLLVFPKGAFAGDATLGVLYLNRVIGLLMVIMGIGCGWVVAHSFSNKKWTVTRQTSAPA
jgi:hypothetical protein